VALSGSRSRAGLQPDRDVPQRDASDRRPHRAAVLDQHIRVRAQEHVAPHGDRIRRADRHRFTASRARASSRARSISLWAPPICSSSGRCRRSSVSLSDGSRFRRHADAGLGKPGRSLLLHEGLTATLRIAAYAVVGSTVVGVLLGTLLTIRFWPLQALIRLYVEVWRGLPILVTIFLVYFALPTTPVIHHRFGAITGAAIGLILWGSAQVAEATRGASSRFRASSTRQRPHLVSAGSAAIAA